MRSKFKWIFTLLLAFSMQFSFAQDKTVSGTITDGKLPLPGANVVIKGTTKGVSADMDGKYSIKAKAGDVLEFSFQGYEKKTVTVGAASSYNVSLKEVAKTIEEVVVTSVGIKKKKDQITSSQQQISGKDVGLAQNPNAVQALAGKISGLQVNTVASGVNNATRIVLRGSRTITGNSQALVVIDNAISTADMLTQIPAEMIESMNVIKGAQGAALYGDQGSNGVIIVNTKRGTNNSSGKPQISISSSTDFSSVLFVPKAQSSYGQGWTPSAGEVFDDGSGVHDAYTPVENGSWGPAFNDPRYVGAVLPVGLPQANGSFIMSPYSPIKDNIKKFFRTGVTTQNGFSYNSGNEDGYALLAYNRLSNDFVVRDDKSTKNTFIFKGGKKMGKFSIDGAATYVSQITTQTDSDLYDDLLQTANTVPVDQFTSDSNFHHWTIWATSPNWKIANARYDDHDSNFNGNLALGYKINNNISVRNTSNVRLMNNLHEYHNNGQASFSYLYDLSATPYTINGQNIWNYTDLNDASAIISSYYTQSNVSQSFYNDLIFNFDYELTKKIGLKMNIGNNIQDSYGRTMTAGGTGINKPGIYNVNNVLNPGDVSFSGNVGDTPGEFYNASLKLTNAWSRTRKVAGFANLDMNYEDYLFLNATARLEKSSTIKSSQFYPSVGLSWVPTKQFASLKDSKTIKYLKLYGSYVITGNSTSVLAYKTFGGSGVLGTGYPFGSLSSYVYPTTAGSGQADPNIKPEFVYTKELGFNTMFFNNRVGLDGSFYINDTKDLINSSSTATSSTIQSFLSNVGSLRNKGMEIDLSLTPVKTQDFKWDVKASYSTYDTKVLSLANGVNELAMQSFSSRGVGIYAVVGESFPMIKGTTFNRDDQGRIIVDATGIPTNSSSLQNIAKVNPDYILGFTNTLEYKGVRFTAVLDYRTGNHIYSDTKRLMTFAGTDQWTADVDRQGGWVWPNSINANGTANTSTISYPAMVTYFTNGNLSKVAEPFVIDGTALKVRELSLGYTLPSKVSSKLGLRSIAFGLYARNPFILLAKDNRMYTDPEASNTLGNAQGFSPTGQYPTVKTYGFNLNVNF